MYRYMWGLALHHQKGESLAGAGVGEQCDVRTVGVIPRCVAPF